MPDELPERFVLCNLNGPTKGAWRGVSGLHRITHDDPSLPIQHPRDVCRLPDLMWEREHSFRPQQKNRHHQQRNQPHPHSHHHHPQL